MAAADPRTLTTARLVMRPMDDSDLADLVALMADAEVAGRLYHGVLDEAGARALLEDYKATWRAHGYGMWSLRRRDDGTFVGVCGLWNRDDGLGVATRIALAKAVWGQDFAGEAGRAVLRYAFEVAGLERLISMTRATNPVAERALIRIGWRLEERFEKAGRVLLRYVMTRAEWLQRRTDEDEPGAPD